MITRFCRAAWLTVRLSECCEVEEISRQVGSWFCKTGGGTIAP
jgi:hypothetical protein